MGKLGNAISDYHFKLYDCHVGNVFGPGMSDGLVCFIDFEQKEMEVLYSYGGLYASMHFIFGRI